MYKFLNNGSSQKYVIQKSNSFQNVRKVSSKCMWWSLLLVNLLSVFSNFAKNSDSTIGTTVKLSRFILNKVYCSQSPRENKFSFNIVLVP